MLYFFLSLSILSFFFFFFNDTATTEIYTLSLDDALPISASGLQARQNASAVCFARSLPLCQRSEEHTSELQSRRDLVCRLLLEKKKKKTNTTNDSRKRRKEQ